MKIIIDIPDNKIKLIKDCIMFDNMVDIEIYDTVLDAIRNGKPLLKEQRTGKWVGIEYDGYSDGHPVYDVWECSICHEEHEGDYDSLPRYCPNCGVRMKGEKKDEEN